MAWVKGCWTEKVLGIGLGLMLTGLAQAQESLTADNARQSRLATSAAQAPPSAGALDVHAPIKPEFDPRYYRYLRLGNGLRALLISDPEADKAVAALDVDLSSTDSRSRRPGLASLVERNLVAEHFGTSAADGFSIYLERHGGRQESRTDVSYSRYVFDIEPPQLNSALERWVRRFHSPSGSHVGLKEELGAVYRQYQRDLESDKHRAQHIYRILMQPGHRSALGAADFQQWFAELEALEEQTLSAELKSFAEHHYRPSNMALVLVGRDSLDSLQSLLESTFGRLKDEAEGELAPVSQPTAMFSEAFLPARINIKSSQQTRRLSLLFPIEKLAGHYQQKPLEYIAHLLSYKGEGGLESLLRDLGWATEIRAGSILDGKEQALFEISLELTELGVRANEQLVALVFHQLGVLRRKGLAPWRYAELQRLGEIEFRYRQPRWDRDAASALARRMRFYAPEDLLRSDVHYSGYNERLLKEYLGGMRSDRVLVSLTVPELGSDPAAGQPQGNYQLTELNPKQPEIKDRIQKKLVLPPANPFIPERLVMKEASLLPSGALASDFPKLIVDRARSRVWFKQAHSFPEPKASLSIQLNSPLVAASLQGAARAELLAALARDQLTAYVYPAELAGLQFEVDATGRGLEIYLYGYTGRQSLLLNKIVQSINNAHFTPESFASIKAELLADLRNEEDFAEQIARLHSSPAWTKAELAAAVEEETLEEFRLFGTAILENAELKALFYGNLYPQEALRLAALVENRLLGDTSRRELAPERVYQVRADIGMRVLRRPAFKERRSVLLYVQGLQPSIEDMAQVQMLRKILQLEAEQSPRFRGPGSSRLQIAPMALKDIEGALFSLESPNHTEFELMRVLNDFLYDVRDRRHELLEPARNALLEELRTPAEDLGEQARSYWNSLRQGDYDFSRKAELARAVEQVGAQSLEHYFGAVFLDSSRRLWVVSDRSPILEAYQAIENAEAYQASLKAIAHP